MNSVNTILGKQKEFFNAGKTRDIGFRLEMLGALRRAIKEHEEEILNALKLDLNKAPFEAYETEVGVVLEEIKFIMKHLASWAKPKLVYTPSILFASVSRIYTEPYGSVLVMAPWNYPFMLPLVPLVGAIAAGNCVVLKPSAYAPHTALVIEKLLGSIFEESFVAVVRGGREVNKTLLDEPFDYIFFTGGTEVGKTVMQAAAKRLTPVTLELGGKSPCIVDETANLKLAAKRIIWGKLMNAGQTCVAPDYFLVHRSVKARLIEEMVRCITAMYSEHPLSSDEYPKIINQKHFDRLLGLMQSGRIVAGGQSDAEALRIAPTIIDDVTWESAVMQEEIFGPLMPVMEFDNLDDVISMLNARPKPLALYLFTTSKQNEKKVIGSVSFGGGCVNETIIHISNPHMPFGGVGESGMGQYHGRFSYDTFSHAKGIVKKSNLLDIFVRYPPFKNRMWFLKLVMR